MLLLGGIGRLAVVDAPIGEAEADLVRSVADDRTAVLDTAATLGSTLTDTWTVVGVLIGAVTVLVALGHRRYAGVMVVGIGLELTAFLVVGAIVDRSRPAVEALHSVPSTPSFPSGHVAAAVVLYGSLAFSASCISRTGRPPGWVWIVPAVVGAAVASSRVYEGVHYPTDVLAGFVLGAGALYGAVHTMRLNGRLTGKLTKQDTGTGAPRSSDPDATEPAESDAIRRAVLERRT
jgi:undecaprenyl-diphosphatase